MYYKVSDLHPCYTIVYAQSTIGDGVWQDDPATIHRCADTLAAVQERFNFRVKMADVWPIKNVWAIVKDKVKESEPVNKEALRKVIIKCWREINADKSLLARLMFSIPRRLQAVISNDGNQIRPNEY